MQQWIKNLRVTYKENVGGEIIEKGAVKKENKKE